MEARYQPQGLARINKLNPITRDLVFSALPGIGDVVGGGRPVLYGTAGTRAWKGGKVYTSTSTSTDAVAITPHASFYTKIQRDFTIAFRIEVTSIAVYCNYISIPYRSGSWSSPFNALVVYANGADGDKTTVQWCAQGAGAESGTFSSNLIGSGGSFIVTRSGPNVSIYKDGNLLQTVTASGNSLIDFNTKEPVVLFNATNSSLPNAGCSGVLRTCDIWSRALSSGEVKAYDLENYAIFSVEDDDEDFIPGSTGITPPTGTLTITGYAPSVTRTLNQNITAGSGSLTITGYPPTVTQGSGTDRFPATGTLTITGYAPSITQPQSASPLRGTLTITGYAPTVTQGPPVEPPTSNPNMRLQKRRRSCR